MAVPKRKTSKSRTRSRARSHKKPVLTLKPCPQCDAAHRPHRVCPACGYYRGRPVVSVEA